VRVTDALGQTSTSTEFLRIDGPTPPPPDPPSSGPAIEAGVVVLIVLGLLAAVYAYRRLRPSPRGPVPAERSALPTVRQLMRQSQIIDRETLLLLCEEAGETPEAAQAALKVLIRTAEVSTEPGPGNDEVLRWKGAGTRDAVEEDTP
jgi:hypothetical protein